MKEAFIISGGNIEVDFALDFLKKHKKEGAWLVAADRGLEFFLKTGLTPDAAVGDFDSLSEEGRVFLAGLNRTEVIRLKPEKDDSDTQSAVNFCMDRGAEQITVLGGTGKRVDHLLANLGLLVLGKERGVRVNLVDAWNYMTLIESGTVLNRSEQFGRYVSFFSLGGDVPGLTLTGFKYPLTRHHLTAADSGLTVSNELTSPHARVSYDSGTLLMLMTRD